MTEEERAALFRQQYANRIAWEQASLNALKGNEVAAQRVRNAWQPRLDALLPSVAVPLPAEPPPAPPHVPAWVELPERFKRP